MTGRLSGKPGHEVRKYAVSRGETVPRTNNTLKKRIHGQPLEDAVVAVVREVLLNVPNLHDALANIIQDNMRQVRDDTENPEQLQKEILRKQKQLALLSDDVELEEDGVLTKKAEKIKADLRALKQRQQAVPQPAKRKTLAPDALADEMANEILGYSKVLDQRDNPHIARLLGLLISRMTADLETKEVEIEFSLPSWVGAALHKRGPMGLDELTAYNPLIEAHPENQQIWAQFRCDQVVRPVCYQCKRMKKAA